MVIFRHHKGGLAESMATAVEFNDFDELKAYIVEYYKKLYKELLGCKAEPISLEDIVIEEKEKYDDERIGWHDTMYVCIKRLGSEDYMKEYNCPQCIDMCATDY